MERMPHQRRQPPGDLWARPDIAAALRARHWGEVFHAYRAACGITQDELAARVCMPQSHVSAIERGVRGITKLDAVERVVAALGIPWAALGHVDPAPPAALDRADVISDDDEVRRRRFLGYGGFAATTVALPSVLTQAADARIGSGDIARFRAELDRLDQLDDRYGGVGVFDLTIAAVGQLRKVRETTSFDPAVGRQLDYLIAEGAFHAGWAAYDIEQSGLARTWWLEALHSADLAEDEHVPLMVYVTMSMQAHVAGRGREAVALAQRAQRSVAALPSSRRVRSLILTREAAGHATAGNLRLAWKTFARLDDDVEEHSADDPQWLAFWGVGELAAHRAGSARQAGDLPAYEAAARDAVAAVDPVLFPRNHMSYQTLLSDALVRRGKLDEALPVIGQAVMQSTTIGSPRIRRRVADILGGLETHRASPAVAGMLDWSREYIPCRDPSR